MDGIQLLNIFFNDICLAEFKSVLWKHKSNVSQVTNFILHCKYD